MKLVIDIREHSLIENCEYLLKTNDTFKNNAIIEKVSLELGDIIIKDNEDNEILIIERKTISDLLASIKDGRYSEQSYRLNGIEHENHNIIYLIEGSSKDLIYDKQTVYSSIFSINYYKGFSVYRSENIKESAYILLNMCLKLKKEKNKNPYYSLKKDLEKGKEEDEKYCSVIKKKKNSNINKENFGEIILCQIPSISSVTAIAIMKEYKTINNLIEKLKADKDCLSNIKYETEKKQIRKISKTCIKNIIEFLLI